MTTAGSGVYRDAIEALSTSFGQSVTLEQTEGRTAIVVEAGRVHDALLCLRSDGKFLFDMLTDLFAVDCYGHSPRFELVYVLNSLSLKQRLVVKTRVPENGRVMSVCDIWRSADWLERETYDMFGIVFDNHPDLRRILMNEDFDGYPLRKDFPTEGYGFDQPFVVTLEEEEA
jgi:NADH-quinone oxidoreductase subunit C